MFDTDDAQAVFRALAEVEASKAGRDFVYTVDRESGGSVTGQVVERTDSHLVLVVTSEGDNRHENVSWDDVARIALTSE